MDDPPELFALWIEDVNATGPATVYVVLGVPMLAAAWMSACLLIDRWVLAGKPINTDR